MKKLIHNDTSVVNINYHLIWCPKYRKKVLANGVDIRLKEILPEIAKKLDCEIDTMEVMSDHVHVFLRGTPIIPIHLVVKNLKGRSSHILRNEFSFLKSKLPNLWTRSYYCETIGCINEDTIKRYIEEQKNK